MHGHNIHSLATVNYQLPRGETLFHPPLTNILENIQRLFKNNPKIFKDFFARKFALAANHQLYSGNIQRLFGQPTAAINSSHQQQQPAAAINSSHQQQPSTAATSSSSNQQQQSTAATSSSHQQQQPAAAINSSHQQQQSTATTNINKDQLSSY